MNNKRKMKKKKKGKTEIQGRNQEIGKSINKFK
jgi:hypothetical protein